MTKLKLDPAASRIFVRTFAEGMFGALAHDLELEARRFDASAEVDDGKCSIEVSVPVAELRVRGTVKRGTVHEDGLSPSDRADVETKIRREVLRAERVVARASAAFPEADRELASEVTVEVGSAKARVQTRAKVKRQDDGTVRVSGEAELRQTALGQKPVKGPLGAFRLKDAVTVGYELTLRPEP